MPETAKAIDKTPPSNMPEDGDRSNPPSSEAPQESFEDKEQENTGAGPNLEKLKGESTENSLESSSPIEYKRIYEKKTSSPVEPKGDVSASSPTPSDKSGDKRTPQKEDATMDQDIQEDPDKDTPLKPEEASDADDVPDVEKSDDAMDTEDQDASQPDHGEESVASKELPYSTRGRSTGTDTGSGGESWDRGARESLEEIGRVKETSPATLGVSFLESLSEEERRTRTRFLPDVEGMHVLRKHEIKDDLTLARSLVSSSGVTSLKKTKGKKSSEDDEGMDIDEDEAASPSEDDRSSDVARPGTTTIELPTRDLVVPSNAFIAPPGTSGASSDDGIEGPGAASGLSKAQNGHQSPLVVDSLTAFNPPRPPESIGAKKKHRMLRWERRPEDVEVDLGNYRKTVQRTRQELHSAEAEYERLETIDAHLRWHFLHHLNLMNEEYMRLNEELGSVQQECVKAADLLTSRTRSRGAGKGSYVMRDVLAVLKAKGAENKESMETESSPIVSNPVYASGVGGLTPAAFCDWNRKTTITPKKPACAWIVPGEMVRTPYGKGVVLEVHPLETVDVSGDSPESSKQSVDGDKVTGSTKSKSRKQSTAKLLVKRAVKTSSKSKTTVSTLLPPRVSIRMPFGVGHFALDTVTPTENPALFGDSKLVERWDKLMKSALTVGPCIDLEGMSSLLEKGSVEKESNEDFVGEDKSMETEGSSGANEYEKGAGKGADEEQARFMPFGAGLFPTSIGRGNLIPQISITDIEKGMHAALYSGSGILGKTTSLGVTEEFRSWEDEQQEYLTLQASVLQLRNALVRQRRIRLLNERTSAATAERYTRAEELVAEMRADLKSLKHRLEEELNELGITEDTADQILSNFYYGQDNPVSGEASPLKRTRRTMNREDEDHSENASGKYGDELDRESADGLEDLSGDDLETHRASKKQRPNQ